MFSTDLYHYKLIGELFTYPKCTLTDVIGHFKWICEYYQGTRAYIDAFKRHLSSLPVKSQKEYYIKTFDVQALCYLDIGYVLFGEDYQRGEFLVFLKNEYRKTHLDWGTELPDHLTNVLFLMYISKDDEFKKEFAYCLLIPAIREMIRNFHSDNNVYKGLLEMLLIILETDFKDLPYEQFEIKTNTKSDFLDCIGCSWKKSKENLKV